MADWTRVGHVELFQRRLHGQRVHHGRQHTDVVGLSAVHAGRRAGNAAEDVAAADDDRDLNAHRNDRLDVVRNRADHFVVQTELAPAHQRFPGQFQQNTLVDGWLCHATSVSARGP